MAVPIAQQNQIPERAVTLKSVDRSIKPNQGMFRKTKSGTRRGLEKIERLFCRAYSSPTTKDSLYTISR